MIDYVVLKDFLPGRIPTPSLADLISDRATRAIAGGNLTEPTTRWAKPHIAFPGGVLLPMDD